MVARAFTPSLVTASVCPIMGCRRRLNHENHSSKLNRWHIGGKICLDMLMMNINED